MSAVLTRVGIPGISVSRPELDGQPGKDGTGRITSPPLHDALESLLETFLFSPQWTDMSQAERAVYIDRLAGDLADAVRAEFRAAALHEHSRSIWTFTHPASTR